MPTPAAVPATPTATAPAMPMATASSTTSSQASNQYRIGPGDVLDVRVFNRPQLSHESLRVENHGVIRMPFIGEIQAACQTEGELSKEITTRLLKYQRNPQVDVSVKQYNSQPVSIMGAVNAPARFQLQRRVRLLEILSLANGPSPRAGRSIQVLHAESPTSMCEPTSAPITPEADAAVTGFSSYSINDTLKGDAQSNPYVRPGDIVTIPDAEQIYIIGNVNRPGAIPLKEPLTISRAIVMAGGTAPNTDTGKVRILRQPPGSADKTQIIVDLKKINKNQAEDIALLANDIIDVPTVGGIRGVFKEIIRTIVPTVSQLPLRVVY
ncbi:MAG: polysaccharide biosynthesis/export family protein [Acidobacteriota bacterium]|nr:polysaccharide biosynthesis/export family protein [Acidobacteriota bacterium]